MKLCNVVLIPILAVLANARVTIDLYYEALCPYCQNFIASTLVPLMKTDVGKEVNVNMYPYGNVNVLADGSLQCQHGPAECSQNKLHACALDVAPTERALNFIGCLETSGGAAASCQTWVQGDEYERILTCHAGPQGEALFQEVARQSRLVSYRSVPFILVNGSPHSLNADFKSAVCAHLSPRPISCYSARQLSLSAAPEGACYRD